MSKTEIMSFKVDSEWKEKIEDLAQQLGKSKSALIRRCVVIGAKVLIQEMKEEKGGILEYTATALPQSVGLKDDSAGKQHPSGEQDDTAHNIDS